VAAGSFRVSSSLGNITVKNQPRQQLVTSRYLFRHCASFGVLRVKMPAKKPDTPRE